MTPETLTKQDIAINPQLAISVGEWQIDGIHSSASFTTKHLGLSTFRGEFKDIAGQLTVSEDSARLVGEVPVSSISVELADLKNHLLSPDFFDAEQYPTLTFDADSIQRDGEHVQVTGELTLRGVTHPVTAAGTLVGPITDPSGKQRLGLDLETTINRLDYQVGGDMTLPTGVVVVSPSVTIRVEAELVAAA